MFLRTDTVTIETGPNSTDDYGYPSGSWTTAATNVAAHFAEKTMQVSTLEGNLSDQTKRGHRLLLPTGTTIAKGNKVTNAAGQSFLVDHVYLDSSGHGITPTRCNVTRSL
jgi:hypothetical protein